MLIEKGYAKLHGCYEAVANGLIEKVFQELTPAGHAICQRINTMKPSMVCDEVWAAIEKGLNENRLVGCMRSVEHPYADISTDRQGITLGN